MAGVIANTRQRVQRGPADSVHGDIGVVGVDDADQRGNRAGVPELPKPSRGVGDSGMVAVSHLPRQALEQIVECRLEDDRGGIRRILGERLTLGGLRQIGNRKSLHVLGKALPIRLPPFAPPGAVMAGVIANTRQRVQRGPADSVHGDIGVVGVDDADQRGNRAGVPELPKPSRGVGDSGMVAVSHLPRQALEQIVECRLEDDRGGIRRILGERLTLGGLRQIGNRQSLHALGEAALVGLPPFAPPRAMVSAIVPHAGERVQCVPADRIDSCLRVIRINETDQGWDRARVVAICDVHSERVVAIALALVDRCLESHEQIVETGLGLSAQRCADPEEDTHDKRREQHSIRRETTINRFAPHGRRPDARARVSADDESAAV